MVSYQIISTNLKMHVRHRTHYTQIERFKVRQTDELKLLLHAVRAFFAQSANKKKNAFTCDTFVAVLAVRSLPTATTRVKKKCCVKVTGDFVCVHIYRVGTADTHSSARLTNQIHVNIINALEFCLQLLSVSSKYSKRIS